MKYMLGVDIGTSATKTVLFTLDGQTVASASREYPLYQEKIGWAEQDPEDWVQAAFATIGQVMAQSGIDKTELTGIGLSGQMHGMVLLDKNMQVLRRAIIWADQRTAAECAEMERILGKEKLISITANPAMTAFTASKILWVKNHQPEIFDKIAHVLLPKDYVRYCLTGELASEVSDASGMQLMDVPGRCWSGEVVSALGFDGAWLPSLHESVEITGRVLPAVAEKIGVASGTAVGGGAGDNAAGAVGNGIVNPGNAFCTIGTSGVVFAHTGKPSIDMQGRLHTLCHAVPGAWHVMGVTQTAGLSLNWFKNQFCQGEMDEAEKQGVNVYGILDQEAGTAPLGCQGLIYLPYLMGERHPHLDPDARGAFFGITAVHKRSDFIRAVMEGVTYGLTDSVDNMRALGVAVEEVRAGGGGGKSILWRQMQADMFHAPVTTVNSTEGPALGVALLAATGAGAFSSIQEACAQVVKTGDYQQPITENSRQYALWHEIYQELYRALKPSYDRVAALCR